MHPSLFLPFAFAALLQAQNSPTCQGKVLRPAGSPASDLSFLLNGSDLAVEQTSDGTFRFPSAAGTHTLTILSKGFLPWQQSIEIPTGCQALQIRLETIQTTIEVREASSDFLATSSISVTKSPVQLLDLPANVQVLPKALLESRNIQDIKDLYRNISGVQDSAYSAMTMRGFTQREVLFNGVRGNPYGSLENDLNDAGFSTSQGRLTNIEFVEVLKGPAAILFGGGEPGGVVNFVTRKPRNQHAGEASFRTGSFRQRGGHGELTGPLFDAKNVFYRAAIYAEDRRLFRYNSGSENLHLTSGLSWRLGEATSLGFEYEYLDQNLLAHRLRGIPTNASGAWLTNREWTASEPTDTSQLQARIFQTRLDHAFTSTLRTDATFRFLDYDRPELYHEPRGLNADGRTMRREFRNQFRGNQDWSLTLNGYERIQRHNLSLGFETVRQDWQGIYGTARERERGGPVPGIDLLAPIYGLSSSYFINSNAFTRQSVQSHRYGWFVQDQFEITPRLFLVAGGRYERFTDDGQAGNLPLRSQFQAFTGRLAGLYRLSSNASVYATTSNSFNRAPSLAQTPLANGPHAAERGRQFEAGAKVELSQGRVLFNAAWFHIDKRNVLRPDPNFGPNGDNFAAVFPIGEVRSRGVELDFTGKLTPQFSILANYAFLDTSIQEDRFTPSAVGKSLPNAARHAGGLFLRYDYTRTGTSLYGGSEMRSRRFEPYAGVAAGGYAVWDFAVFQKLGSYVELRAQLDNASDRLYATASLFAARAGNMPGNPRTFTLGLHFRATKAR
ncbi:MAG: TonB-dependent receptor [Bryobacter sp.]